MKTKSLAFAALTAFMITPPLSARSSEGQPAAVKSGFRSSNGSLTDRLMKMGDRMVIVRNGTAIPMTAPMTLSDGTRVSIDGSVVSKNGSRMKLRDCAAVGMDGRRIEDATARVVVIDGQVMVMKGGVTRRLEMVAHLGNGRSVDQECILTDSRGGQTELKEGQILAMNSGGRSGSFNDVKRNIGMTR